MLKVTSRQLFTEDDLVSALDIFQQPGHPGFFMGLFTPNPHIPTNVSTFWTFSQDDLDRIPEGRFIWHLYAYMLRPWERQMISKANIIPSKQKGLAKTMEEIKVNPGWEYAVFPEHLWTQAWHDPDCAIQFGSPIGMFSGTVPMGKMLVGGDVTSFMSDSLNVAPILQDNQIFVMGGPAMYNFGTVDLAVDMTNPRNPQYTVTVELGIGVQGAIVSFDP